MALLEVESLTKRFRSLTAVDAVSLTIHNGEMVSLIGPNGAGKSTFFDCLSGIGRPDGGSIVFAGRPILDLPPHERALLGIGRTFQTAQLWSELTVLENLVVAAQAVYAMPVIDHLFGLGRRESRGATEVGRVIADFCGLKGVLQRYPGELPLREQRLAELARALCLRPRLLLLDEPASGMDPDETQEFSRLLIRVRARTGVAMLYVEHDMRLVMSVSDYIYVLDFGRCIASGTPAEIRQNPEVRAAYFGAEAAHV